MKTQKVYIFNFYNKLDEKQYYEFYIKASSKDKAYLKIKELNLKDTIDNIAPENIIQDGGVKEISIY